MLEAWYQHHQFVMWSATTIFTLVLTFRAALFEVIRNIPLGWRMYLRHTRTSRAKRLEHFLDDPTLVLREILFVYSALVLYIVSFFTYFFHKYDHFKVRELSELASLNVLPTMAIQMNELVLLFVTGALISIVEIWRFRRPETRSRRARALLRRERMRLTKDARQEGASGRGTTS